MKSPSDMKNNKSIIEEKVREADPIVQKLISEQKKEISKLQSEIVKLQVSKDSEISRMQAEVQACKKQSFEVHFVSPNQTSKSKNS